MILKLRSERTRVTPLDLNMSQYKNGAFTAIDVRANSVDLEETLKFFQMAQDYPQDVTGLSFSIMGVISLLSVVQHPTAAIKILAFILR